MNIQTIDLRVYDINWINFQQYRESVIYIGLFFNNTDKIATKFISQSLDQYV